MVHRPGMGLLASLGHHGQMDIERLRAQTPGCAHRIHLNNAGAALMSAADAGRDDGPPAAGGRDRRIRGGRALRGTHRRHLRRRSPSWSVAAPTRWPCSTTPRTPGTPRSTRSRCRPGDRILTGRPSTAATSWPTCRWRSAPAPRWSSFPTTSTGSSTSMRLAALVDERTRLIGVSHGSRPAAAWSTRPPRSGGWPARRACCTCWMPPRSVGQFPVDVEESAATCSPAPVASSCVARAAPASCGSASGAGPARALRRRDPLGDVGRRAWLRLGRRRPAVRDLGEQLRQRPGSRRCGPAGPRPRTRRDRGARLRASAAGCATGWTSCPASPPTTSACSAARSSPPQ